MKCEIVEAKTKKQECMKYFVVAVGSYKDHPAHAVPIEAWDEVNDKSHSMVVLFNSREEAEQMAAKQPLCQSAGYEIYEWPSLETWRQRWRQEWGME